jgi:uncharacterized protein YegP (UPF0339 family)
LEVSKMAEFELYKDNAGQYRWRFRASNGRIVADSAEGYVSRDGAENGIQIVKREAPLARTQDLTTAGSRRW